MTFVGKILVVVQVVLSICFMAFAGAVHSVQTSWKDKYTALEQTSSQRAAELSTQLEETKLASEQAIKEKNDATNDAAKLQAQVAGLTNERDSLQNELKVEKDASIKEQAVALRSGTEAAVRNEEAASQRTINTSLLDSREALVAEVQRLQDEKFNREAEMSKLFARHKELLIENSDMKTIISNNGLSTDPRDYKDKQPPPETVEGLVYNTQKRGGTEFIEISLGSDDGLEKGHHLHVYRLEDGGKYLGKIQIVEVSVDRAVGTLISRSRSGSIQRGDNVTTKL